jgi:hypothetical protein
VAGVVESTAAGCAGALSGVPGETIATSAFAALAVAGFAGGSIIRITLGSGRDALPDGELAATLSGNCCQADAEITPVSVAGCGLLPEAGAAAGWLAGGVGSGLELCGKLNPPGGE